VYSFNVKGSAFLWHQIRHMVAVLFLVGQGLESPSVVTELLDIEANPGRPGYVMAHDAPLVLWDCIFPAGSRDVRGPDALEWVYAGDTWMPTLLGKEGLLNTVWESWREHKIEEVLANQLLQHISSQVTLGPLKDGDRDKLSQGTKLFEGSHGPRQIGKYRPLMQMDRLEAPEVVNDRWAKRKGFADSNEMRAAKGARRVAEDVTMEE
jgi:tRNA pseudouridine38/39 synthase